MITIDENTRAVCIGVLGEKGVGITTLLEFIGAMAEKAGVGHATDEGCVMKVNGVVYDLREYHMDDFLDGQPRADYWYYVADGSEGPCDMDVNFYVMGIERVEAVFFNKCDLMDFDDELIDLEKIEARRCLELNRMPVDSILFIPGSATWAAEGKRAGGVNAVAELLQDILAHQPL